MPLTDPVTVAEPAPVTADDVDITKGRIVVYAPLKDSTTGRVFAQEAEASVSLAIDVLPPAKVAEAEQVIKDILAFKGVWTP